MNSLNNFIPQSQQEDKKTTFQKSFERDVYLHTKVLDLAGHQNKQIAASLKGALTTSAREWFYDDPNNNMWLVFNGQRVSIKADLSEFFNATLNRFENVIKGENFPYLDNEYIESIMVKAHSALYSGYKFYFREVAEGLVKCLGKPIEPRRGHSVNVMDLVEEIISDFKGFLTFEGPHSKS
jgi:hypothetical protein